MNMINFASSPHNTLGIELELQILDPVTFDLAGRAGQILEQVAGHPYAHRIKPEVTEAMIELNSSVHEHPAGLLAEMREMRSILCNAADAAGVRIAGGGAHPFMNWQDNTIFDSPRFRYLADMYGYLAPKFTVFGQHIHLGVANGDAACSLIHRLSPYVSHLIALSASSPYYEGVDTLFSCSRLNALHSFPLSGHMPPDTHDWYQFEAYYMRMRSLGLVESLKDLYWDIRPKPELGTVEIRVCDTPLTIEKACQLAAFAQALAISVQRRPEPHAGLWLAYDSNRFQASRFGLQAQYVTDKGERIRLIEHLRATFDMVLPVAEELGSTDLVEGLQATTLKMGGDAHWMRARFNKHQSLPDVVGAAADLWRGEMAETLPQEPTRRRVRASSEPITSGMPAIPVSSRRLPSRLH